MKRHVLSVLGLLLGMAFLVNGCAVDSQTFQIILRAVSDTQTASIEAAKAQLEDRTWILESIDGVTPVATTDITLVFVPALGKERPDYVSGRTGCADNGYGAPYELLIGQRIDIIETELAVEEEGCAEPLAEEQEKYLAILRDVTTYSVEDSQLTLQTDAGETLVFIAQE